MCVTAFSIFWHLSPTLTSNRDGSHQVLFAVLETVAEIEKQSDSTTAVGQSRGRMAMIFLHSPWRTKLLPRHKFNIWNVCST